MHPNCAFGAFQLLIRYLILSAVANIFTPMQSTNQGSIISVRTSDASYKTVSSGGWHTHPAAQQSVVYHHDYNRINTWNHITLPVSSPTGKTTSFTSIHQEVDQDLFNQQLTAEITSGPRRAPGPGGPAIGEDKPGSPIGDMLLPMLVIALGYIVVELFRNRKTSQAL